MHLSDHSIGIVHQLSTSPRPAKKAFTAVESVMSTVSLPTRCTFVQPGFQRRGDRGADTVHRPGDHGGLAEGLFLLNHARTLWPLHTAAIDARAVLWRKRRRGIGACRYPWAMPPGRRKAQPSAAATPLSSLVTTTPTRSDAVVLDDVDRQILVLLSTDSQRSQRAMARALGMSAPAVGERIGRPERLGVILGHGIRVG